VAGSEGALPSSSWPPWECVTHVKRTLMQVMMSKNCRLLPNKLNCVSSFLAPTLA